MWGTPPLKWASPRSDGSAWGFRQLTWGFRSSMLPWAPGFLVYPAVGTSLQWAAVPPEWAWGDQGWGAEGSGVKMLPAAARRPGSWALTNAGPLRSEPGLRLALQQALGCRNCNFLGHNVRWNGSLYQQEWHSNLSLGMQCIQTPHFLNEMEL